jgi:hypothetical protein
MENTLDDYNYQPALEGVPDPYGQGDIPTEHPCSGEKVMNNYLLTKKGKRYA